MGWRSGDVGKSQEGQRRSMMCSKDQCLRLYWKRVSVSWSSFSKRLSLCSSITFLSHVILHRCIACQKVIFLFDDFDPFKQVRMISVELMEKYSRVNKFICKHKPSQHSHRTESCKGPPTQVFSISEAGWGVAGRCWERQHFPKLYKLMLMCRRYEEVSFREKVKTSLIRPDSGALKSPAGSALTISVKGSKPLKVLSLLVSCHQANMLMNVNAGLCQRWREN